jgi:hypothetical protein
MEQASMLDLLQIIGMLLKVFAFVVLAITLATTSVVIVFIFLQRWLSRSDSLGQRAAT